MTKKKKQRGGFRGRSTTGHKTVVLGFYELNIASEPRCGTGRAVLIEIPNATRRTIEEAIRKYVRIGSIIWTDGHASYKWLGQGVKPGQHSEVSGFTWDWVNHKKGQFVRVTGVERISTNGVESLFGRMKKFFRASGVTNVHDQRYALHLAEFLWRERFLSRRFLHTSAWEMPAVWLLADLIGNVFKHSSLRCIEPGDQMGAHNSAELQALREMCFPHVQQHVEPTPPTVH